MEDEITAKIILVGDSGVGKTTISNWALTGSFNDQFLPTVGGNYVSKDVIINGSTIKLQIWDTAGDEKYRSLIPMFFRDARGAVLVYSIKDRKSFQVLDFFVSTIRDKAPNVFMIVVGNKSDMETERQVTFEEGQQFATDIQAEFIETSAKTGTYIGILLEMIAKQVYETRNVIADQNKDDKGIRIDNKTHSQCSC